MPNDITRTSGVHVLMPYNAEECKIMQNNDRAHVFMFAFLLSCFDYTTQGSHTGGACRIYRTCLRVPEDVRRRISHFRTLLTRLWVLLITFPRKMTRHLLPNLEKSGFWSKGGQVPFWRSLTNGKSRKLRTYILIDTPFVDSERLSEIGTALILIFRLVKCPTCNLVLHKPPYRTTLNLTAISSIQAFLSWSS